VPEAAISARGLCRRFGPRWALAEISFTVPHGARALLLGPNGSGKSTLLRVLATALRADRGTALVAGHDLSRAQEEIRRVSALLAHSSFLYESLSALQNLEVAARFLGRPAARSDLLTVLERVGLAERAADAPATFSAGMKRRLSLARLLLQRPAIAFLDEPYAQLDSDGAAFVDRLLDDFRRDGVTVLMATHQGDHAGAAADLTLRLAAGRLA
jgi:heme exporter protein A